MAVLIDIANDIISEGVYYFTQLSDKCRTSEKVRMP